MSTKEGQKTLKKWRELAELAKNTSVEGKVDDEITTLEGLETSIEEHEKYFEITLSCEVKGEGYRLFLDIPYKTDSRKVAVSVGNFFNAAAMHLDYKEGDRLEFKIRLSKPSA